MSVNSIGNKMPEDVRRRIVDCINIALTDDLRRYMAEFHPATTNGVPHNIGDWINTNLRNYLEGNRIRIQDFTRYSWKGKIIIDEDNKVSYTIMRSKRIKQLRREKREKPHYLQTVVAVLNAEFKAEFKQMNLYGMEELSFEKDVLEKDYNSIFHGSITKDSGYVHYVIAYETERNEITDIRACLLDKDLDTVEELSLNDYIKPDFTKLVKNVGDEDDDHTVTEEPKINLISLKAKSKQH